MDPHWQCSLPRVRTRLSTMVICEWRLSWDDTRLAVHFQYLLGVHSNYNSRLWRLLWWDNPGARSDTLTESVRYCSIHDTASHRDSGRNRQVLLLLLHEVKDRSGRPLDPDAWKVMSSVSPTGRLVYLAAPVRFRFTLKWSKHGHRRVWLLAKVDWKG